MGDRQRSGGPAQRDVSHWKGRLAVRTHLCARSSQIPQPHSVVRRAGEEGVVDGRHLQGSDAATARVSAFAVYLQLRRHSRLLVSLEIPQVIVVVQTEVSNVVCRCRGSAGEEV